MANIHAVIGTDHYRTKIRTATNLLIADEPLTSGGEDLGFSPEELLAASLSACTCATLRMYADRKGWTELTGVTVDITFARQQDMSSIVRNITLQGPLSEEQKDRLLVIANKCPIHQVLTHPVIIETSLV
jgi:putative redox protein